MDKNFRERKHSVTVRYKNQSFVHTISNLDDYRILEEMFADKQYNIPDAISPKTIVDLGSNIGISIIYFKAEYPDAHIYGFEPASNCFAQLSKTVGSLPMVTIENMALGTEEGKTVSLNIHPDGHSGSSTLPIADATTEEVTTTTLDALVEKYALTSIDILKVDIEGMEYEVFQNFKNLALVKYILVEVHPAEFKRSVDDFLALFPDFTVFDNEENAYTTKVRMVKLRNSTL